MDVLAALKREEAKLRKRLTGIEGAIAALTGRASRAKGTRAKRVVSAALRAELSQKAKERWAKVKTEKSKGKKVK